MLVVGDSRLLTDDFLPPAEAVLRYREQKIEPLHDTYRLSDHTDLKNLHKRSGRRMHSSELVWRVRRLNPRVFVQHQINYPGEWGFYLDVRGRRTYISGFRKGWLREFSAIEVDERNLQKGDELRGWRTVLLRLLQTGTLTWAQVSAEFGDSEGANCRRWRCYTRIFRQSLAVSKVRKNLGR